MQATTWSTGDGRSTYKGQLTQIWGVSRYPGGKDAQIGNLGMYNN